MSKLADKIKERARLRIDQIVAGLFKNAKFRDFIFKQLSKLDADQLDKELEKRINTAVNSILKSTNIPFLPLFSKYIAAQIHKLLDIAGPEQMYQGLLKTLTKAQREYLIKQDLLQQEKIDVHLEQIREMLRPHLTARDALLDFLAKPQQKQFEFIDEHDAIWPQVESEWLNAKEAILIVETSQKMTFDEIDRIASKTIKLPDLRALSLKKIAEYKQWIRDEIEHTKKSYDSQTEQKIQDIFGDFQKYEKMQRMILLGLIVLVIVISAIVIVWRRTSKTKEHTNHLTVSPTLHPLSLPQTQTTVAL